MFVGVFFFPSKKQWKHVKTKKENIVDESAGNLSENFKDQKNTRCSIFSQVSTISIEGKGPITTS